MKNPLFLVLALFLGCFSAFGQSSSEFERTFEFDNESSVSEFVIEVDPNTNKLSFNVNSVIKQGDLRISLMSPSGKKEGGFRLQSTMGKNKSKEKEKEKPTSKEKSKTSSSTSSNSNSNSNSNSTSVTVNTNSNSSGNTVEVNADGDNTFVYSASSNSNSTSRGNMTKSISNPQAGTWRVIVDPKGVSGDVLIKIFQRSQN